MAPRPPARKTKDQAAAAPGTVPSSNTTTMDPSLPQYARVRSDSNGSTRGAFYSGGPDLFSGSNGMGGRYTENAQATGAETTLPRRTKAHTNKESSPLSHQPQQPSKAKKRRPRRPASQQLNVASGSGVPSMSEVATLAAASMNQPHHVGYGAVSKSVDAGGYPTPAAYSTATSVSAAAAAPYPSSTSIQAPLGNGSSIVVQQKHSRTQQVLSSKGYIEEHTVPQPPRRLLSTIRDVSDDVDMSVSEDRSASASSDHAYWSGLDGGSAQANPRSDSLRYSSRSILLPGTSNASLYGDDFLANWTSQNSVTSAAATATTTPQGASVSLTRQEQDIINFSSMATTAAPITTTTTTTTAEIQKQDIMNFSSMATAVFEPTPGSTNGSHSAPIPPRTSTNVASAALATTASLPSNNKSIPYQAQGLPPSSTDTSEYEYSLPNPDDADSSFGSIDSDDFYGPGLQGLVMSFLDPTPWLTRDAIIDASGKASFPPTTSSWTLAAATRYLLWNPLDPEFTSLQQFSWAVIIGILMGLYAAGWKTLIEGGIDVIWDDIPTFLLEIGVFTSVDGAFPLYHYMWICPAVFGGLLSYIFAVLPIKIPDQNDWINNVHTRGVQDYRTFVVLFVLSTAGMWSGLSLGPELPLVLTAGMFGSWLGLACKQSMLQARVLNLTAASAAVAGFFGFPMAGALFVLELPHRMGLQYFEALSPATTSSVVAVLSNRLFSGNDVTGYFSYPFLTATLPSEIFTHAMVYGFFGAAVGIAYAKGVKIIKTATHDLFHEHHDDNNHDNHGPPLDNSVETGALDENCKHPTDEREPLMKKNQLSQKVHHAGTSAVTHSVSLRERVSRLFNSCSIHDDGHRAAAVGVIAGAACGVIGIFVPHCMFWGEAQLQNLIDKGRTPLPIFGQDDEPTAALVELAFCMIDNNDPEAVKAGFGIGCSAVITVMKVVVVGLSLGTGIIGGHFWGPLFIGCSASHFLGDVVHLVSGYIGFGSSLAAYPCLIILCTMGSAHVVTFRAHMAIMLILTLTISAFDPEDGMNSSLKVAGDYSAVFPLLVVSVSVALMISRGTVFYATQRNRGDIVAVPEVLCEPGMAGRPMVLEFDAEESSNDEERRGTSDEDNGLEFGTDSDFFDSSNKLDEDITQNDIEREFEAQKAASQSEGQDAFKATTETSPPKETISKSPFSTIDSGAPPPLSSARLDELLSQPVESIGRPRRSHRRTQSAPGVPQMMTSRRRGSYDFGQNKLAPHVEEANPVPSPAARFEGNRSRANSGSNKGSLVRINSFGEIEKHQPSLMDQARLRSASSATESRHRRVPSLPMGRHSRKGSDASAMSVAFSTVSGNPGDFGALALDDIQQAFNFVTEQPSGSTAAQQSQEAFSSLRSVWTNNSSDGDASS